ncbi:glycosyltransferase [Virgibacillus soli]|uniref:Glycosyltransferase n=1 Tax=Paracerasibacillus soli TaxID=480284 RepID=A0ABU5CWU7_9BACI|nr:glycosyltransferase [Virgibacillus soli]MDY0410351.1 glycosyltransferase [Virgibacillus soli]
MKKQRLKILMLIKPFWVYPKHRPKIDTIKELEKYADVYYWHSDGNIQDILTKLNITPDFIFHYDIAWNFGLAPNITGLDKTSIPKGCFVIDLHWQPETRATYFTKNKIDIIFSATKHPFLNVFPQFKDKLRWLPWSINPDVMKDWKLEKTIDYLLMGLVYVNPSDLGRHMCPKKIPPKGRYAFRDAVFTQMRDMPHFVFHPHPGHRVQNADQLIVNKKYAKELNRAKLFFTCGSRDKAGGVAVLKFLEAPACKTLLLAEPNKDIQELGFVDGENYVACNTDNVVEKAKYYLENKKERERITENGYKLIHTHHTNTHRAKFIINEIKNLKR